MTPEMQSAFQLGAGFSVQGLYQLIASLLAAGLFIWGVWTIVGHYRYWADGGGDVDWLLWSIAAVLILLLILVHYL